MWKRLISYPLAACEQIPLVMAIFSDKNETEVVQSLCGNDGQAFVDVIDEVFPLALSSRMNKATNLNQIVMFFRVDVGYPGTVAPEEMPEHSA